MCIADVNLIEVAKLMEEDVETNQLDEEEGFMWLRSSFVQGPTRRPVAVPIRVLLPQLLVDVQDGARRRGDRFRPVDRDVAYDRHPQVRMRLEAERQDRNANEEHGHQADDLTKQTNKGKDASKCGKTEECCNDVISWHRYEMRQNSATQCFLGLACRARQ